MCLNSFSISWLNLVLETILNRKDHDFEQPCGKQHNLVKILLASNMKDQLFVDMILTSPVS